MDIESVSAELYVLWPERFIAARDAQARLARAAGERGLAAEIAQLRRPAVSAWLVNLLVRRRRASIDSLLALSTELRAAQETLAGDDLRRLAGVRQKLIAGLVRDARDLAGQNDHSMSVAVEEELTATLEAVLADPRAAAAVQPGRLVTPLRHSGFGWGELSGAPVPSRSAGAQSVQRPARKPTTGDKALRVARLAAQRAAEHALAAARQAATEAAQAAARQQGAQAVVADLQARLEEARQELSAAEEAVKVTARAARAAQRRAEQAGQAVERR
ncbi:MAG: hypothetical protein ABJA34_04975 [Pseudonocardiales bacterium]